MVGLTSADARSLFQAFLPGVRPIRIDRMEDLVGELCNQMLGRINSFFTERSVSIQHGTPIFIRAAGSTLRYPGRQPSFAVTLKRGDTRVALEYYLGQFDSRPPASAGQHARAPPGRDPLPVGRAARASRFRSSSQA